MRVKPISRTIKANALTNPNPSYVSLVKAGANQKPWRAVKMDAAVPVETPEDVSMKIKPTQKAANAVVAAVAPKGFGVMQFEFASAEFADEPAVKAWMDAGGYDDYTIVATKTGFEVVDDDGRFIAGSVSKIDGFAKGVTAFVGKLTNPDLTEEEQVGDAVDTAKAAADAIAAAASPVVDPPARTRSAEATPPAGEADAPAGDIVAPAADVVEPTTVADTASAISAPAEPVPGVIPEEQPATPPAAEPAAPAAPAVEVVVQPVAAPPATAQRAAEVAIRGVLDQNPRTKGVYEASSLGEIVNRLAWIIYDADYTGLSEETVTKINGAALALLDAFMQAATDAAEELAEVFGVPEQDTAAARSDPAVVTETPVDIAAVVAAAVREAIAPLEVRVATAESAVTEANAATETAQRALSERVEADNARGQTRQGADDPLAPESTSKTAAPRSQTSKSMLSAFGSRHA